MKEKFVFVLASISFATEFDYCSIKHSQLVADDVKGYFIEVFNEFGVPISQSCPFTQLSLIE